MVLLYKQTTLLDYAAGKAYVSLLHAYVSLLNAYVSLLHACLLRNAKGNSSFVKDKQTVSAFKNKKKNHGMCPIHDDWNKFIFNVLSNFTM